MRIRFCGDFLPSRGFDPGECFEQGELRIVNLECALRVAGGGTPAKAHLALADEADLEPLERGLFSAVCLANNHSLDARVEGLRRLLERLARIPELAIFGTRDVPHATLGGVAIIGCIERCRSRGALLFPEEDAEQLVRQLARTHDQVVVYPHWGKEGEFTPWPSPWQRHLAARWIGAGASAVIGHHAHLVQGCEEVGGRPVWYSIGNLHFDHPECRSYPGTRLGKTVVLDLAGPACRWEDQLHVARGRTLARLDEHAAARREARLRRLAGQYQDMGAWRWARRVGPGYLAKSRRSWAQRFRKSPSRALPLWLAWNMMPRTLLLRLGALARAAESPWGTR